MPGTSDRARSTQSGFPAQPNGAVAECPYRRQAAAVQAPVEVKETFEMTQQILQTLGTKPAEVKEVKKAWIEIILVDAEGKPMPGVRYRITPPGGAPVEGRLNEHGQAGLYSIDPGNCKITFPDLDKDAWE
jgi:hypothetical protein